MRRAWVATGAALVLAGGLEAAVLLQPSASTPAVRVTPAPTPTRTPLLVPAAPGTPVSAAGLRQALAGLQRDRALGPQLRLSVVDAVTGAPLLDAGGDVLATPASTAKLATAVAALTVLGPDARFVTRLVSGPAGSVVLVGGGDPTLAGEVPGLATAARLATLARGVRASRVVVDDSLFTGPRLGAGWKPSYAAQGNVAPVSALEVDEGRQSARKGSPRALDPALAAGAELARLVGARSVVRGKAADSAVELARVQSPPVSELVEAMLTSSDNDLAEALGRQVALARGLPGSYDGEVRATSLVLRGIGIGGVALHDASGLSPQDRLQPKALTALLVRAVSDPVLAPVLTGLPVAGFDGTLAERFRTSAWAGQVRAKTGTLDGVAALAGLVRTRDGRLLVFAALADRVPVGGTSGAEKALDRIAEALAACGCR